MLEQIFIYLELAPSDALRSPIFWYFSAILLALFAAWWIIRSSRTELVAVLKDETGTVQITPQALRELVRKSCACIPGISDPATSIFKDGKTIRLKIRIRIDSDCRVKEVRDQLGKKLEAIMVDNLSFSNFGGVDVIIRGFHQNLEST